MRNKCVIVLFCVLFLCVTELAYSQSLFEKGLKDFQEENYEEALEFFLGARKLEPTSSSVAFYLGLTYKIMENYKDAIPYFRDAVTYPPQVKEALIELIDALYQTGQLSEARKWIEVGEKEGVQPARLQFLKGLVLLKEGKDTEAVIAFENAKKLDKTMTQAVEFQIANIYMKQGKLKDAQNRLKFLITIDPNTDTATFARDYEKLVSDKIERERPWRFGISLGMKYDSNVIAQPSSNTIGGTPAPDSISGKEDMGNNMTLRVGYTAPFSFNKPYSFSLQYALGADRYFRRDDYNSMTQTISAVPGYNFDKFSLTLPVTFSYSWLQRDKGTDFLNDPANWMFNDAKYMQYIGVNPTVRFMIGQNSVGEFSLGYGEKEYLLPPAAPAEDMDGHILTGSLGWTYFFKEGKGLFGVKYTYSEEYTDGDNWTNKEHRFGMNVLYPLRDKLKFQLTGDAAFTKYTYTNNVFNMARRNDTYSTSLGFIYDLFKNTGVIAQYSYTRDKCNIDVYDYKREVIMLGMEYRY